MTTGQPPLLHPPYGSTRKRAPLEPPVVVPATLSETTGPVFGPHDVGPHDADLTRAGALGQKIFITGQVVDESGRPLARTLVEIWQANAAGRYRHEADTFGAPLDPSFVGAGRALTDDEGRYRFVTIRPGAYPWRNHHNAWRPAHIHFSLFGVAFAQRLVTQMYFEGDPLLPHDPIWTSIPDEEARDRLVARHDWRTTEDHHGLGYRFDIVLAGLPGRPGPGGTPFEP